MNANRKNFISRLEALKSACDEPLLVNTADLHHNERAKQLRCGMCVMAFSALEDFIRLRTENVLKMLVPAALPFAYLPDIFRTAATLGALQAIQFQQKFISEDQKIQFLMDQFRSLSTLSDQNYNVSKYTFVHSGSNVQLSEITALLEAMSVEKPWETIYYTARRLKLATANPSKAEFETLSSNRHAAAHQQAFDIPNIDLKARIDSALSIGLALDVVLTAAARNLNSTMARYREIRQLKSRSISVYFVSTTLLRNKYRLEQEGATKAILTNTVLQTVKSAALHKLATAEGVVILHDGTYRPKEWYCEP